MSAIKDTVKASKDLVAASISIVGVTAEVAAMGAGLLKDSISEVVPCAKALATSPLAATEGYLVQEGMDTAEAHAKAYRYVNQPLSVTITEVGVGSGKLLSDLLKDEEANDAAAPSVEEATA